MPEQQLNEEPFAHTTGPLSPSHLLTPQATAIAGFAFAVFSMLGQGSWSTALSSLFWGSNYDLGTVRYVMVIWGVGYFLMAGLGAWLAYRTLRVSNEKWEAHLARAAVIIAAAGAVLAVATIIGGLVHGG